VWLQYATNDLNRNYIELSFGNLPLNNGKIKVVGFIKVCQRFINMLRVTPKCCLTSTLMFCISHFILNTHRLWITYFNKTQLAPQFFFAKLKNIQKKHEPNITNEGSVSIGRWLLKVCVKKEFKILKMMHLFSFWMIQTTKISYIYKQQALFTMIPIINFRDTMHSYFGI